METKWVANKKMKELLEYTLSNPSSELLNINLQQLNRLFSPSFKQVKDCIIITEKSIDKLESAFDRMLKTYMDRTGYEASNTETRINCYFENDISMVAGMQIALMVIDVWALKLKQIEPSSKFCMILCSNEERVEIRFHKVRETEITWFCDDLEDYEEAVGYILI